MFDGLSGWQVGQFGSNFMGLAMKGKVVMLNLTPKMLIKSFVVLVMAMVMVILNGCGGAAGGGAVTEVARPALFLTLPDYCNTPDGMTLDSETGNIILAAPNFNDESYPGVLLKIDPENNVSLFYAMPVHPETGRGCPMGLDFGPDGNLYVADNQYFYNERDKKDHRSRLIRVNIKDGQAVSADVVVEGFQLSNAVIWKGDTIFVSDTFMDLPNEKGISSIYKFNIAEFKDSPVKLKPFGTDEHIIGRLKTDPNPRDDMAGADGITLDSRGNLYIGSFGDGKVHKFIFSDDGSVASQEIFVDNPKELPCSDGLFCDLETDIVYVNDSQRNAIVAISPNGMVRTMWVNEDTDGADGLLDQPCECVIRGDEMIIANFDMPFPGLKNKAFDKPYTLSVIKMAK